MTSELQTPDPDGSNSKVVTQPTKINRELAWRIAPSLLISFKYAWAGSSYAFRTQRNFRIHVILGALALAASAYLRLSAVEISVVGLTIGAVLAMELLNTAIESVVDLTVKQNYHELAKIAKDCAAAAVLISALAAIGVASSLILPRLCIKLWQVFQVSSFFH
ncbi:diacylglycerol kinase family protein [Phormidium sp. CLA17]|uniref:diacylglycerol kinase n=1 Tax=Leptolyngbya sp. Cla-17 TaxID=2803751 RepID=UPI001491F6B6|nr:diacylglycerol kinase family protein [Leptolyngbya sp. Cla-17]MBM0742954.1 diacylglycerol kinase family protein [Leptolyngbya sp. Cla-17]